MVCIVLAVMEEVAAEEVLRLSVLTLLVLLAVVAATLPFKVQPQGIHSEAVEAKVAMQPQ